MNGMAASDKMFRLLDLKGQESDADEKKEESAGTDETDYSGVCAAENEGAYAVAAKEVTFSYEGQKEILKAVTVEIPANSFVSIVGESGCGKGQAGITVYGISDCAERRGTGRRKRYPKCFFRERMKQMTLVSFQNYLFKGSVRENIADGRCRMRLSRNCLKC